MKHEHDGWRFRPLRVTTVTARSFFIETSGVIFGSSIDHPFPSVVLPPSFDSRDVSNVHLANRSLLSQQNLRHEYTRFATNVSTAHGAFPVEVPFVLSDGENERLDPRENAASRRYPSLFDPSAEREGRSRGERTCTFERGSPRRL